MRVRRKISPGQPGTKKWVEKYGSRLVCVRYRYDSGRKRKYKTVEIIVEEGPWADKRGTRIAEEKIMFIRIDYGEIKLGRKVRSACGRWNRGKQLWELSFKDILKMELTDRIVY